VAERRPKTGVEFLEAVTNEVAARIVADIKRLQQVMGERPAFSERLSRKERLALWMQIEMSGPGGWEQFYLDRKQEGLSPDEAALEAIRFNAWAKRQFAAPEGETSGGTGS
jgi:hypothetical protein